MTMYFFFPTRILQKLKTFFQDLKDPQLRDLLMFMTSVKVVKFVKVVMKWIQNLKKKQKREVANRKR